MDEARFSRSCARVVLGVRCRGEPPFKRYEGTAERDLGGKVGEMLLVEGILGVLWLIWGRMVEMSRKTHGSAEGKSRPD